MFYIVGLISVLASLFFLVRENILKRNFPLNSPLPTFLTAFENAQVSTLGLWLPSIDYAQNKTFSAPDISAQAGLVYDLKTQKVLFAKNSQKRLPMASLSKIMTAVVAIEHQRSDDRYAVLKSDLVGENAMGLSEGEVLTLEDLLYGLILTSGNDAAETLARNSIGRTQFIKAMNDKAKSLGLSDTHFTNPTGLEGDGLQYTTPYDLLILTNYALQYPLFRSVVATFDYHIPYADTHKEYYLENETNLLASYPGVLGVKTGYTPEAGLCLVTYLNYDGHKIIGVILGSDNRRQEMKDLLDYGLKIQGLTPPPHG